MLIGSHSSNPLSTYDLKEYEEHLRNKFPTRISNTNINTSDKRTQSN